MKKLLLIFFTAVVTSTVSAQSDFRHGYVIMHSQDTVHGLVDYREGLRKYHTCDFKTSDAAAVVQYTAAEIKGYHFVNDKFFVSKSIKSHADTVAIVFVEVIVRGRISLYRYDKDFFVSKDESPLHKLTNERYETVINGDRVITSSNRYIGVLNHLMADCRNVKSRIARTDLFERPLTEVVQAYNTCMAAPTVTFKSKLPYAKATLGLVGGAGVSALSFQDPHQQYLQGEFEQSIAPVGGVSVDIFSPRVNQRLSFHAELLYGHDTYVSFFFLRERHYTHRHYVKIDAETLQLPLGIRYHFPEREFTPFFNAGVTSHYHVSRTTSWTWERQTDDVIQTYEDPAVRIGRHQLGLWGGAGVSKKISSAYDLYIEARYSRTLDGVVANESLQHAHPSISSFQILLGIRTR